LVIPHAARDVGDGSWASNCLPVDAWVVRSREPVKAEVAARLNDGRQVGALIPAADTTILSATIPATILSWAAVIDTNTTTWNEQIKLIASEISSGVGSLDNHSLSGYGTGSKGKLVALAAPARLASTRNVDSREAISKVAIDSPWLVAGTSVCGSSTIAAGLDIRAKCTLILVTGLYRSRD